MSLSNRRKKRLLIATVLASLFVVVAVVAGVLRPWEGEASYVPGERVEGIVASLEREAPAATPDVLFTDVAEAAGLRFRHFHGGRSVQLPEDMGSGVAVGDYDGDGLEDIYLVNITGPLEDRARWAESPATSRLFRNLGGGRFEDVTDAAGVGFRGVGMAAVFADVDDDGDLDLLVTAYEGVALYRNDGGRFTDIAVEAGLGQEGFFTGAAFADYDRDGDLDLYLCRYVRYALNAADRARTSRQYDAVVPFTLNPSSYPPAPNVLYRNEGSGRFTDVTAVAGVANPTGRSLTASFGDFDSDGWPDLYVANDVSDNAMFRNRGDGTFADVSHEAWVADYRGAMGLAYGDADNDGDLDMFVTHWIAQENAFYRNLSGEVRSRPPSTPSAAGGLATFAAGSPPLAGQAAAAASASRPPLRFQDDADTVGLGQSTLDFVGWGTAFLDYDLDGWLDLVMANGSTFQDDQRPPRLIPMQAQLFWNRGRRDGFYEVSKRSGADFVRPRVGRGLAVTDYDGDGDPDVVLSVHDGPAVLLRNDQRLSRHYLRVRLVGAGKNRFAVGARVSLTAGGLTQMREVVAGTSYLSHNGYVLLFGLGAATAVDRLEVRWPDGSRETYPVAGVDREVVLAEGQGGAADAAPAGPGAVAGVPAAAGAGQGAAVAPASPRDRETVRRFWETYRKALAAKDSARFPEAIALFTEALKLDPRHETSLYFLGTTHFELRNYAGAEAAWKRLVEVNPANAGGHFQLGALYSCPEPGAPFDLDRAVHHFEAVIHLNAEQTGPFTRLGEVALLRGDLPRAARFFENVIRTNHVDVASYYLLGFIRLREGRPDLAAALLGKAVEAGKGQSPVRGVLGEGDSTTRLTTTFPRRRLFAPLWLDLQKKGYGTTPTVDQARAEYAAVERYLEGLRPRLLGGSAKPSN